MAAAYYNEPDLAPPGAGLRPHPCLQEPILYLSNLNPSVTEAQLAALLQFCTPFRPIIDRDASGQMLLGTGSITFKYFESAEKALATLQSVPIPDTYPTVLLSLSPFPPTVPPIPTPPPMAKPRLVKHLPEDFADNDLYDLFRPFGCLASVRTQAGFGPGTGAIEFYYEEEAHVAEETMHCAEIQGQNISVQTYTPRKPSGTYTEFSPNAPAFVPSGVPFTTYTQTSPRTSVNYGSPTPFMHGPGQQVQLAPLSGPGSTSHSGLIDPCNLFIKNIDPEVDSKALFNQFRAFGHIVSARVMRNEQGGSRGFGFVSFQTPEQAANAMHSMNGVQLGNKQVIVRLHEPKQLRQEKLAQRFANSSHPRSSSGATSPTLSEGAESFGGWPSPGRTFSGSATLTSERPRRSSGSYYHAALSGNLNLSMQYDDLAALSPVVRREVLAGELSRRIKELESVTVPDDELETVVDSLINLSLTQVVEGIHSPSKLSEQVTTIQQTRAGTLEAPVPEKSSSNSPAPSQDSRLLDPQALIATASAPEQPSTPLSISGSISDPPRTSSPSGSLNASGERERLLAAVAKLDRPEEQAAAITNLLMSLSKRERAMCLFSNEILKQKVKEAEEIFNLENEPEEKPVDKPIPQKKTSVSATESNPLLPEAKAATITPDVPANGSSYTLATLAELPATEIIRLTKDPSSSGSLPLPKADSLVVQSTDAFIDSLQSQGPNQQKQAVGEKLFKFVKAAGGGRLAGKITIQLLDNEELRSLAHLMNSYPSVLKEKAEVISKQLSAK